MKSKWSFSSEISFKFLHLIDSPNFPFHSNVFGILLKLVSPPGKLSVEQLCANIGPCKKKTTNMFKKHLSANISAKHNKCVSCIDVYKTQQIYVMQIWQYGKCEWQVVSIILRIWVWGSWRWWWWWDNRVTGS